MKAKILEIKNITKKIGSNDDNFTEK